MSELGIDPDAINRFISERILESSIGEALRKEIDSQVTKLSSQYDNPMKPVVAAALASMAREYLETPEVSAKMRAAVSEAMAGEVLDTFIKKVISESYRR